MATRRSAAQSLLLPLHGGAANFLSALVLAATVLLAASQSAIGGGAEPEMPVKIVLFPLHEAVVSSTVPARVAEYKVREGQSFGANEPIACLDDRAYRQAFAKGKASILEAQAGLKFTEANFKRNKELFERKAIGNLELEQSELDRDVAAAKLQYSIAGFELAKLDLDACLIKVPFGGRLTKRTVKESEFVGAGQPILEVVDDEKLLAAMHLPSSWLRAIKIGDEMSFKVDETGSVHKGKIYVISGRIDFESRTFDVKLLVDNPDHKLMAGMSGVLLPKADGKRPGGL